MTTIAADLRYAADKIEALEQCLDRISANAFTLCRTLGYTHGEDSAEFVGPPTIPGFVSTEAAVRQLLESLRAARQ